MALSSPAAIFDVLTRAGMLSVVTAGPDLVVTGAAGRSAEGIAPGRPLPAQMPALVGLEPDLEELAREPGRRLELPNISMVGRGSAAVREDVVVFFDAGSGGFVVTIAPSLANSPLAIELEQALRRNYLLERRVAAQTRTVMAANDALRRANEDLADFTRIVSHDLKAPMRAMRYTADDLEQAIAAGDTGDQAAALAELRFMTTRFSRMVADLLAYVRLDDKSEAASDVDTGALVATIIASLPRPPTLAVVVVGDWPVIRTVAPLLDLVLRNLVDNAIKHHDTSRGTIELVAAPGPACLEITVVDDGPGIPERHRNDVLAPFARLGRDGDPASGLGLTMVDKILRQVGGGIEFAGRDDGRRGTCVRITWPLTSQPG